MKKLKNNDIKLNPIIIVVALAFFILISARVTFLALSTEVDGINLQVFASKRTTRTDVLVAKRGSIYDKNGDVLAQNISSYTLIAYLAESRTTNPDKPQHVVDKEKTAEELSKVLNISKEKILGYLNTPGVYQTEFGSKGRGLTELTKDAILALKLPGLDFIETQKRYYPFGDFLSYSLGYAKPVVKEIDGEKKEVIVGEMGIEKSYNDLLTGKDGFTFYQKDRNGYKITGTDEITVDAKDGNDVYLTIDSNIQLFVEHALDNALNKYSFDWMTIMLADAKTGAILASATNPSFDPNIKNMTNYLDYNVSYAFEPGSTMKIFSYMATMENGNYDGEAKYKSGVYITNDGTEIGDWHREGWGNITFDYGFTMSSNVAVINLINRYISGGILKDYYKQLGFGSKTGIELPNESSGKIKFKYETEIYNAGFGQGITTTPVQNIQALTSIANDGMLLQPYIIDKVVDDKGEVIYNGGRTELRQVASKETTEKIKELMRTVIEDKTSTGSSYYMEGYDIIAKTGTAQVANQQGTGYTEGVIRGFAGMFPGKDPDVIVYVATKNPSHGGLAPIKSVVQEIIVNVSKYLEIDHSKATQETLKEYKLDSYINKKVKDVETALNRNELNYVVIGDGDIIIDQYPSKGENVTVLDKVVLITNGKTKTIPSLIGLSSNQARIILNYLGIKYKFEGSGYVTKQSIKEGTKITDQEEIILTLEKKKI